MDRNDFRNMFEYQIREARSKKMEDRVEFDKKYS
jgi:hypothetical protein